MPLFRRLLMALRCHAAATLAADATALPPCQLPPDAAALIVPMMMLIFRHAADVDVYAA